MDTNKLDSIANYPRLIGQWSDSNTLDPTEVSIGSGREVLWRCTKEHTFKRTVRKFAQSQICPICKGIEVITGENDCITLFPEIKQTVIINQDILELSKTGKSSTKIFTWRCIDCNSEYTMRLSSYIDSKRKCKDCRTSRNFKPGSTIVDVFPELVSMWSNSNILTPDQIAYGSSKYWNWVCSLGHEFKAIAHKMNRKIKTICPICNDDQIQPGFNDLAIILPEIAEQWSSENLLKASEIGIGSNYSARFICTEGHYFERIVANHVTAGGRCPDCQTIPPGSSLLELEILKFIKESVTVETKVIHRSKDLGVEVDIWIPDLKLGIEVNGDYWHSNEMSLKTLGITAAERHLRKLLKVEEQSATLLYVWESDWRSRKSLVNSALLRAINDQKDIDSILQILEKD